MSAEKGGALVRSPPGLVPGVDAYSPHMAPPTSNTWDTPMLAKQHRQKNGNASVTKIPSGQSILSKDSRRTRNAKNNKYNEEDSEDYVCGCEGWARARQLEHDLDQLHLIHEAILKGLHRQLEEMKQKNRDMTFQMLMGPYANTVKMDNPISPESDAISPKEEKNVSAKKSANKESFEIPKHQDEPEENVSVTRRKNKGRAGTGDPRQVRSLNLELLEQEHEELKKQLEEEKAKNKYLLNITEDLKRQIRTEVSGTSNSSTLALMRSMQPAAAKQPVPGSFPKLDTDQNEGSINIGSKHIRLPQITKQEKKSRESSAGSKERKPKENIQNQSSQTKESAPNTQREKRNKDEKIQVLPAIGQSSEKAIETLKLKEIEFTDYGLQPDTPTKPSKSKQKGKGKHKSKKLNSGETSAQSQSQQVTNSGSKKESTVPENLAEASLLLDSTSERKESRPSSSRQRKKLHTQNQINLNIDSKMESCPKSPRGRNSGSLSRTSRENSIGRVPSLTRKDSSKTITGKSSSSPKPPSSPKVNRDKHSAQKPSSQSNNSSQHKQDLNSKSPKKAETSEAETSSSVSVLTTANVLSSSVNSIDSSSTQAGTPSSSGKSKHKSRNHRRGKGKNKKENQESPREDPPN